MLPRIRALLACALTACACSHEAEEPRDVGGLAVVPERPPPVVLVVADALRADRLASYGNAAGLTPALDAIASESVRVERVIAPAPWTQPAVASLLTGLYPGAHGVTRYDAAVGNALDGEPAERVVDTRLETLAEVLAGAEYDTAAFVASPFLAADFGFDQGFGHYESPEPGRTWTGAELAEAALAWLDARESERPPFVYLHFMETHGPYEAAPERLEPLLDAVESLAAPRRLSAAERERLGYLERLPRQAVDPARHARLADTLAYWRARYDAAVRELDAAVADLARALDERELWQDALVVVTADHGEALLDGGLWGHGGSMQHPELHVPLLWRWPGVLPAGTAVDGPTSLVDVLPTLLDLLGLAPPAAAQGRSLAAALTGAASDGAVPVFAEAVRSGPEQMAVYRGPYQLVRTVGTSGSVERLYDLDAEDRDSDLGPRRPDVRRTLAAALDAQLRANAERADARRNGARP